MASTHTHHDFSSSTSDSWISTTGSEISETEAESVDHSLYKVFSVVRFVMDTPTMARGEECNAAVERVSFEGEQVAIERSTGEEIVNGETANEQAAVEKSANEELDNDDLTIKPVANEQPINDDLTIEQIPNEQPATLQTVNAVPTRNPSPTFSLPAIKVHKGRLGPMLGFELDDLRAAANGTKAGAATPFQEPLRNQANPPETERVKFFAMIQRRFMREQVYNPSLASDTSSGRKTDVEDWRDFDWNVIYSAVCKLKGIPYDPRGWRGGGEGRKVETKVSGAHNENDDVTVVDDPDAITAIKDKREATNAIDDPDAITVINDNGNANTISESNDKGQGYNGKALTSLEYESLRLLIEDQHKKWKRSLKRNRNVDKKLVDPDTITIELPDGSMHTVGLPKRIGPTNFHEAHMPEGYVLSSVVNAQALADAVHPADKIDVIGSAYNHPELSSVTFDRGISRILAKRKAGIALSPDELAFEEETAQADRARYFGLKGRFDDSLRPLMAKLRLDGSDLGLALDPESLEGQWMVFRNLAERRRRKSERLEPRWGDTTESDYKFRLLAHQYVDMRQKYKSGRAALSLFLGTAICIMWVAAIILVSTLVLTVRRARAAEAHA